MWRKISLQLELERALELESTKSETTLRLYSGSIMKERWQLRHITYIWQLYTRLMQLAQMPLPFTSHVWMSSPFALRWKGCRLARTNNSFLGTQAQQEAHFSRWPRKLLLSGPLSSTHSRNAQFHRHTAVCPTRLNLTTVVWLLNSMPFVFFLLFMNAPEDPPFFLAARALQNLLDWADATH